MSKRYVRKPWGWYLTLLDRKHFKVKILKFKAEHACSLQQHRQRKELWLFLKGGGWFSNGMRGASPKAGDYQLVTEKAWHKFTAWNKTLVLEVQYGEKCDEEDIIRV